MLSKFLIKIPSSFSRSTERAIAIFIANGNPSGIDTINITRAVIPIFPNLRIDEFEKNYSCLLNKIKNIKNNICVAKLKNVATIAYFPICFAVYSSFSSRKVYYCYTSYSY